MSKFIKITDDNQELMHFGVPGMRWGHRKTPSTLSTTPSMSRVTKKVVGDYNSMDDQQFMNKYQTTKRVYAKRVEKYGDPYMNAPLAKFGKSRQERKDRRQAKKERKKQIADDTLYEVLEKRYKGIPAGRFAANRAIGALGGVVASNLIGGALYTRGLTSLGANIVTYGSLAAIGSGVGGLIADNMNKKTYEALRYKREHS